MKRLTLLLIVTGISLFIACGGKADERDRPETSETQDNPVRNTPKPALLVDSITEDHLAAMVPDEEEVEPIFAGFASDSDGEVLTPALAADRTVDPVDVGPDVTAAGYLNGFERNFRVPRQAGIGVTIQTRVQLWEDEAAAAKFIESSDSDFRRLAGTELSDTVELVDYETVDHETIADSSLVFRSTTKISLLPNNLTTTFVVWQRGAMVGTVGSAAFDEADRMEELLALATVMDHRILDVLSGQIAP